MNKKLIWLIGLLISLSFSSCITILDEIKLNADKSGEVFIGLESEALASVLSMAKDQLSPEIIAQIDQFPNEAKDRLTGIEGIHHISSMEQVQNGRLGISFQFDNPKALNKAYYALMDMEKKWYLPNLIKIKKHKIKRKNITPQLVKQIEENNPDLKDSQILKYLNWKSVIKLPANSTAINNVQSKSAVGNKEVVIRYSLSDLLKNEKSSAYEIRF